MEQGLFGSSESLSLLVRVLFAEPYSASSFGEKLDKWMSPSEPHMSKQEPTC